MLDRDLLYQKFIVEDKSVEEVAKYFNTTIGSINYWNKKYNFHKRKKKCRHEILSIPGNLQSRHFIFIRNVHKEETNVR